MQTKQNLYAIEFSLQQPNLKKKVIFFFYKPMCSYLFLFLRLKDRKTVLVFLSYQEFELIRNRISSLPNFHHYICIFPRSSKSNIHIYKY